jgi:hypothetical protein
LNRFGVLETEPLPGKNLQRVLLAAFPDFEAANSVCAEVRARWFSDAFVVEYEDGKRGRTWEAGK